MIKKCYLEKGEDLKKIPQKQKTHKKIRRKKIFLKNTNFLIYEKNKIKNKTNSKLNKFTNKKT